MNALHPTQFQLECFSSGEPVEFAGQTLTAHLQLCADCTAYLEKLSQEKAQFVATRPAADVFVRKLRRDAAPPATWHAVFRWGAAAAFVAAVLSLGGLQVEPPRSAPSDSRMFVAKGGGTSFSVIRKRQADQQLQSGRISIIPGDQLRLRFNLQAKAEVAAGVLVDDGTWVPFFEGDFPAGTHTPEATLQVDQNPSSGTVLFGSPSEVARARADRNFARVETAELIWTAPP